MKRELQNRINMLTSVSGVLTKHNATWNGHEAFAEGTTEFNGLLLNVGEQSLVIVNSTGASEAKKLAVETLNIAVGEIMGAVASYANDVANAELAVKVAYAESEVTKGVTSDVVARCQNIHTVATQNLATLGRYGVTADKLTALQARIAAYDNLKVAPRENFISRRTARGLQEQHVRAATAILRDKLDRLIVQFKTANPAFYEEYYVARVVVDSRGGNSNTDVQPTPTPIPAPIPA
jgi:hypothetical protein